MKLGFSQQRRPSEGDWRTKGGSAGFKYGGESRWQT